jgi:uridine phosphorylase
MLKSCGERGVGMASLAIAVEEGKAVESMGIESLFA